MSLSSHHAARRTLVGAAGLAVLLGLGAAAPRPRASVPAARLAEPPIAITHVTLIAMTGAPPLADATVVTRGDRIVAAGASSAVAVPRDARVIDGTGRFLIPGLWDMHVHLTHAGEGALGVLVANGVTGVRDMGGDLTTLRRWRGEIERGERVGPRIVMAGPLLDGPGHLTEDRVIVSTAAQGVRAVDSLHALGVDFIKVYEYLPRDAYFGIASEARRLGVPFAGHVPRGVSPIEAADAGQRSFEHLRGVPLPCPRMMAFLGHLAGDAMPPCGDDGDRRKVFARMIRDGTWAVPTLVSYLGVARSAQRDADADPRLAYASPALRARWRAQLARWPSAVPQSYKHTLFDLYLKTTVQAHRAGVPMLAGSDLGNPYVIPGFALHDELGLLVRAGLSPREALASATSLPARFFGTDSIGRIAPGAVADLVLLDADPLADVRSSARIAGVMTRGRWLDRSALDRLLADARR